MVLLLVLCVELGLRITAVRYIKNNQLDIIKERFASAILENRGRDFWTEAKKVCGGISRSPCDVDGLSQSEEIADQFARKYEDLYSCVSFNENEMASLKQEINDKLDSPSPNSAVRRRLHGRREQPTSQCESIIPTHHH